MRSKCGHPVRFSFKEDCVICSVRLRSPMDVTLQHSINYMVYLLFTLIHNLGFMSVMVSCLILGIFLLGIRWSILSGIFPGCHWTKDHKSQWLNRESALLCLHNPELCSRTGWPHHWVLRLNFTTTRLHPHLAFCLLTCYYYSPSSLKNIRGLSFSKFSSS